MPKCVKSLVPWSEILTNYITISHPFCLNETHDMIGSKMYLKKSHVVFDTSKTLAPLVKTFATYSKWLSRVIDPLGPIPTSYEEDM